MLFHCAQLFPLYASHDVISLRHQRNIGDRGTREDRQGEKGGEGKKRGTKLFNFKLFFFTKFGNKENLRVVSWTFQREQKIVIVLYQVKKVTRHSCLRHVFRRGSRRRERERGRVSPVTGGVQETTSSRRRP